MSCYLLQFFVFEHLKPELQVISKPFGEAARELAAMSDEQLEEQIDLHHRSQASAVLSQLRGTIDRATPPNPEATWAVVKIGEAIELLRQRQGLETVLRRLLEAKDCAVRALIFTYKEPER